MQRLLKRRKIQEVFEEVEKDMGESGLSLNELESLLNEEGIDTKVESLPTRRIASNETTRFMLIKNVKQALEDAKKKKDHTPEPSNQGEEKLCGNEQSKRDELEDDLQKAIQMSLECVNEADTSACTKTDDSWISFMTDSDYNDSEEDNSFDPTSMLHMSTAKDYIMQYSDFTNAVIDDIVVPKHQIGKSKNKVTIVNQILEDLSKEKSVIVDKVDLTSIDDDCSQSKLSKYQTVMKCNVTAEDVGSPVKDIHVDTIQSPVVCIENSMENVTSLNTSMEGNIVTKAVNAEILSSDNEVKDLSDSSDDDFEEVFDADNESCKHVVQLTLNVGRAPVDDIFADIFKENHQKASNTDNLEHDSKILGETSEISDIKGNKSTDNINMISNKDNGKITPVITKANENAGLEKHMDESLNIKDCHTNEQSEIKSNPGITKEPHHSKETISTERLNTIVEEIENEEKDLFKEKSRLDRMGRNITEQMTKEAQELLQIFGIPYVVAPMEAEAQCAFLESVNLIDGTITDDSDIWLFGGRTVYKNFFNQKKHVLQFLADRIEKSFNLSREQLILLALLVGSDYTTGVNGVGPVTALEILASFPFNKKQLLNDASKQSHYTRIVAGLQEFKRWVRAGKKTDNTSLKKKLKNVVLNEDFPSIRVVQAYLEPNVERSKERFTWGELDITILRDYAKSRFGWSQNKLDEIIKPVLKRMLNRKTQKTVQNYFKGKIEFQSLEEQMSKRVRAAVKKMGPEPNPEENVEGNKDVTKRKGNKDKAKMEKEGSKDIQAGPSHPKQKKANVIKGQTVKVVSKIEEGKSVIEICIPKSDRVQEIIPQKEKDKQSLLQNKLKAIEIFRKTKIDRKKKPTKRRPNLPKERAKLSDSDTD